MIPELATVRVHGPGNRALEVRVFEDMTRRDLKIIPFSVTYE